MPTQIDTAVLTLNAFDGAVVNQSVRLQDLTAIVDMEAALATRVDVMVMQQDTPASIDMIAEDAARVTQGAQTYRAGGAGFGWYDKSHVYPQNYSPGVIQQPTTVQFVIYSSFRSNIQWSGVGDSIPGVTYSQTFPTTVAPSETRSFNVTFDIVSPSIVSAPLTFSIPGRPMADVDLTRIYTIIEPPEYPIQETLEYLTSVLPHVDGTEQRVANRIAPRRFFDMRFRFQEGQESQEFENIFFAQQGRPVALPMWHEEVALLADAGAGTDFLSVDVRNTVAVGGLLLLINQNGERTIEVIESISIIKPNTSITIAGELNSDHDAGSRVIPLYPALSMRSQRGTRALNGIQDFTIRFRIDRNYFNTSGIAALGPLLEGKVFLDDCNFVDGSMNETYIRPVRTVDGGTGKVTQRVAWSHNKRNHPQTWELGDLEEQWDVRRFLNEMKGAQKSFFQREYSRGLTPVANLTTGTNTIRIENIGYTDFVREQGRKRRIYVDVEPTPLIRTVTDSVEISDTVEELTVDTAWPQTYTPAQVDRIDFISLVRLASDNVSIEHTSFGVATFVVPVIEVFE